MVDFQALFFDEHPTPTDEPLTLLVAEIDDPYRYLFESRAWLDVYGASRQLLALDETLRTALAELAGAHEFLRADAGQIMTLAADPLLTPPLDVLRRLTRIAPESMGVVTISAALYTLTVRQALNGLYRAPENVIGIPGVNSYQGRINRYYGLASPSTIPTPDAVAARRNFGEVTVLARQLIAQARESRQVFPFYESLPFAERCTACRNRPAEQLIASVPLCGICNRKRLAAQRTLAQAIPALPTLTALIILRVPGLDRQLIAQRSPAAYRRMASTLSGAIRRAATGSGALLLWQSGDEAVLATSVDGVLDAVMRAYVTYTALTRGALHDPLPLFVGAAVGHAAPDILFEAAQGALTDALRLAGGIGLRRLDSAAQSTDTGFYAPDDLERLQRAVRTFGAAHFPITLLTDLPDQLARGTVALYYAYARTRLDTAARRLLDQLEDEWGKDTTRFYRALSDVVGLLALRE